MTERSARALAKAAREHGLACQPFLSAKHGWVANVVTPWHSEAVPLHGVEDLEWLLIELAHDEEWAAA